MRKSINNLLVDSLRSGSREAVKGIISLGMTPLMLVDKVEGDDVSSRTVWAWTHQAPSPEASQECWEGWLAKKLAGMDEKKAAELIDELMDDAISSALSFGQSAPLVSTWKQVAAFSSNHGLPWSRERGLEILSDRFPSLPFRSVPVLEGLRSARILKKADLLDWGRLPLGPWEQVAQRGLDFVLSWMLKASRPAPSSLLVHIERVVWDRLEESLSQGPAQDHVEGFSVRLFSCLNTLASAGQATSMEQVPDGLLRQIARLEKDPAGWPAEVISALGQWKMTGTLPHAQSAPTRSLGGRF